MSRNGSGFTLIELMIVITIIGILAAIAIPNFISMQNRAKEASVKANTHTIQLALEDFAVQNDGEYPMNLQRHKTTYGQTLIELLPGGSKLRNPFTKELTEPTDTRSTKAGCVVYEAIDQDNDGLIEAYSLTGYGRGGLQVITVTSSS